MSTETGGTLGEELGQEGWVNQEPQGCVVYSILAAVACQGALPGYCQAHCLWHKLSTTVSMQRNER